MRSTMLLSAVLALSAVSGDARPDDEVCGGNQVESSSEETVAKAEHCAAGDGRCCDRLTWLRGWGPADLNDIPPELAERVERVLQRLCRKGDRVACAEWPEMLVRLGRSKEALTYHAKNCPEDSGSCEAAADLLERAGELRKAVTYDDRACAKGSSTACAKAGSLWERLGQPAKARKAYGAGCHSDDVNACAGERRLSAPALPASSWEEIYGGGDDVLFIEDLGHGRIRVRMHTTWANGHECSYEGEGTVAGDHATMDADSDADGCQPILLRKEDTISVTDPGDHCRHYWCGTRGGFEVSLKRQMNESRR